MAITPHTHTFDITTATAAEILSGAGTGKVVEHATLRTALDTNLASKQDLDADLTTLASAVVGSKEAAVLHKIEFLTLSQYGINNGLADGDMTTADQGADITAYLAYCATNKKFAHMTGRCRANNIDFPDNLFVFFDNFHLLTIDSALDMVTLTTPAAGTLCTGIYNSVALTNLHMTGRIKITNPVGELTTNAIAAAYFHSLTNCTLPDFHFENVASGLMTHSCTGTRVGNITGNNFDGVQPFGRVGSAGSAWSLAACTHIDAGDMYVTNVDKPALYFSTASGAASVWLGVDNEYVRCGRVVATSGDNASGEFQTVGITSGNHLFFDYIEGYQGKCTLFVGASYSTTDLSNGYVCKNITIGEVNCRSQADSGASLVAGVIVGWTNASLPILEGVRIGTLRASGILQYALWIERASVVVDNLIIEGVASQAQPAVTVGANGSLTIGARARLTNMYLTGFETASSGRIFNAGVIQADPVVATTVGVNPNRSVFLSTSATAFVDFGRVELTGTPDANATYAWLRCLTNTSAIGGSVKGQNIRDTNEGGGAGVAMTNAVVMSGASPTIFKDGLGYLSAAPTAGTWTVGQKFLNSAPSAGGIIGWICTSAGTPGTWRPYHHGDSYEAVATDANFSLTPGTSAIYQRHTGTLTAARTITLSTTLAVAGTSFHITRTGAGLFQLILGSTGHALGVGEWARVVYDGSAYYVATRGTVSIPQGTAILNADKTITPHADCAVQIQSVELTADRAVTLATTNAVAGDRLLIKRSSIGAFNLNVGTGPLKAMATATWATFEYDGSAWVYLTSGAL